MGLRKEPMTIKHLDLEFTVDEALRLRADYERTVRTAQTAIHSLDLELQQHMLSIGAQRLEEDGWLVTYEPTVEWDKTRLTPLLEMEEIPATALAKAYTPEHQETVPASWKHGPGEATGQVWRSCGCYD